MALPNEATAPLAAKMMGEYLEREHRSSILHALRRDVAAAEKEYARMEARLADKVTWYPRTEVPPTGPLWASDGKTVWLIHGDGTPIRPEAVSVLYWTQAGVPLPPDFPNT